MDFIKISELTKGAKTFYLLQRVSDGKFGYVKSTWVDVLEQQTPEGLNFVIPSSNTKANRMWQINWETTTEKAYEQL